MMLANAQHVSIHRSQAAGAGAPARALVVEDHPMFAQQIQEALQRADGGLTPRWCATGADALELLVGDDPDLAIALVDLGLPDMDGSDVIRALRQRRPSTPVLVLSVLSAQDRVLGAIRAGAQGYVLKGSDTDAIAEAISQTLGGHCPISPALARTLFRLAGAPAQATDSADNPGLTPRELQTLRHLSRGLSYKEAAREMGVTPSTLQSYVRCIYRKLDVHSQMEATLAARERGLV